MEIEAGTRAVQEQVASRDTALACLAQLAMQNGLDPAVAAARRGGDTAGDALPISKLIELAGDFGLQVDHARVDWQGLRTIGYADPILILLKNTNVAILIGGGRHGAEEIAVWDPLHRDSEPLFVPRQKFERAWSGDVLRVRLQQPSSTPPSLELRDVAFGQASVGAKPPLPHRRQQLSSLKRCCVIITAIAATAGGGLFLTGFPAPENFTTTSAFVGKAPEPVTEATPSWVSGASVHIPDDEGASVLSTPAAVRSGLPDGDTGATTPTRSDGHVHGPVADQTSRIAALSPEPTSPGEVRALELSLAAPVSAEPPVSSVAAAEAGSTGAAPGRMILPRDAALSAAEIAVLLARGDKSFGSGDVASARLYYGRAANAGDGQAALRLGETFDPLFLEHAHLRSVHGDFAEALSWYRRARDMGIAEAAVLLDGLEAR